MQQISEVIQNQKLKCTGTKQPLELSAEPNLKDSTQLTPRRIEQFFLQIAAIYPYRWTGQFEDKNALKVAKMEWFEALKEMHEHDIRRGLSALRSKGGEFPPSIPEFVKMCTPTLEEFGILSDEIAYKDFCNKDFSNPVVAMTEKALQPRAFDIAQMWAKEHKKTFLQQYDLCIKNYIESEVPRRDAQISQMQTNTKRLEPK